MVTDIVLTTLNARFAHCAFGLRYLLANLPGELAAKTKLLEFDISQPGTQVLEAILKHQPRLVGLGVYIWNAQESYRLAAELKRVAPQVTLVLGGPEVSHEIDLQPIASLADYVIAGEGDLALAELAEKILIHGEKPLLKVIHAPLPEMDRLALPYHLYDDRDLAHRVVYVEASRGCPFRCEFCLSSLEVPVRQVPLERLLAELQRLMARGLKQFKFVDRTFNLNLPVSRAILQFFLDRYSPGLFLHFEMIPDRLPDGLKELIRRFPAGAMQLEIGVQTFNEQVAQRISRKQNNALVEENLRWLKAETGVHVHADLIVGLPGESVESFADGFDRLWRLGPQEIQIGILKRLRGAPIARHDRDWQMVYSPLPAYEILQNGLIDFATMQRLRRLARFWDLVGNSGHFVTTLPLLLSEKPFANLLALSDWLYARTQSTSCIALPRLAEMLFEFLTRERSTDPATAASALWQDYQQSGRSDRPDYLKPFIADWQVQRCAMRRSQIALSPKRQSRHARP